jgi:DNA-binding XRE family transcriptional regulator
MGSGGCFGDGDVLGSTAYRLQIGDFRVILAARVGIAQSSLAQAETGRRGLKVETYAKLAKVLRTRIEDLLAAA